MPVIEDPGIEDPGIEDPGIGIPGMPVPAPFDMSDAAVMPGDIAIIECGRVADPRKTGEELVRRAKAEVMQHQHYFQIGAVPPRGRKAKWTG
jgi:hypothetical protein